MPVPRSIAWRLSCWPLAIVAMFEVIRVSSISVFDTAAFSVACIAAVEPVVTRLTFRDIPSAGNGNARHWSANGRPALANGWARLVKYCGITSPLNDPLSPALVSIAISCWCRLIRSSALRSLIT